MSNYKRKKFNSGVLQNTQQNFARFDKAVQLRDQLRKQVAEKAKANNGAFTPGTLTTEVNQKFGGIKQKLQNLVTNKGLTNAKFLDKKSDFYNNGAEANYNTTKQSATDGLKAMNKAMTSYETYMEAYKKDDLNFNAQEYEAIQNQWGKINEFVNNPDRLGFDDNGNITVAVYNDETEQDEQIPLAQWDVLNFESALKPVPEPDYTENFIGYLGSDPENWDVASQDAIQRAGGRENPNFLGMVSDYIESQYGADLPGHDNMVMDSKYQQEAIDRAIDFAKNRKTETRTGAGQSASKPAAYDDIDKILKIPSVITSGLAKDQEGNLKNDAELRKYIRDKIARGTASTYKDEFRTFMDTQGFQGKEYTDQDVEDAWVNYHKDTMVKAYQDPNQGAAVAGGVSDAYVESERKVKGGVTREAPPTVPRSSVGVVDSRYDTDSLKVEKKNNKHTTTLVDKTGMGHFSYILEGTGTSAGSNFFTVTTDVTPFDGPMIIGSINLDSEGKDSQLDKSLPHEQRGPAEFTPTKILNNVPMLTQAVNFSRLDRPGKARSSWLGLVDKVDGYDLKPGAIITDDFVAMIEEMYPDTWQQYITFGAAAVGNAKFDVGEYTMLMPLDRIQNQLQENTGHNFENMTDAEYNLQGLDKKQLSAVMKSKYVSSAYREKAAELLGL